MTRCTDGARRESRRRRLRLAAAFVAPVMVLVGLTEPAASASSWAADTSGAAGPRIVDPGFDARSWRGTQHNHASFVSPGADGTGSAVQVGLRYADDSTRYPVGGNLPVRGTIVDRGMVNKPVTGVKPNTVYQFSLKLKGRSVRWGIFDAEAKPYYRGYAAGDGGGSYDRGIDTPENGTSWAAYTTQITTGPRTTELNAFCFSAGYTAPAYCDDFAIRELGPAAEPQTAPPTWTEPPLGANGFPVTIPAVQSFVPSSGGDWQARSVSEIVVDSKARGRIGDEAELGAANLKADGFLSSAAQVKYRTVDIKKPDGILVRLGAVPLPASAPPNARKLVHEAYRIEAGPKGITVTAGGEAGVLYAFSTLAQALRSARATHSGLWLPGGTAVNWTDVRYRGLQVDSARRYYSIGWLKDQIKELAYTNLNTLVVRIKDGQGLRVESSVFPELVDHLPDGGSWSKAEVRSLVAFAKRFHVRVIPEFDMPAHAQVDEYVYPNDLLGGESYDYSRADLRDKLAAVAVEMGEVFDAPFVHLGGDEFGGIDYQEKPIQWIRELTGNPEANGRDAYAQFFNGVNAALKAHGRGAAMWNDMLDGRNQVVALDKDIKIMFWAQIGGLSAGEMAAMGHEVIGSSSDLYHDLWPNMQRWDLQYTSRLSNVINRPLPEYAWLEYATPWVFSGGWGPPTTVPVEQREHVGGQVFPIWDDSHGWAPEHVVNLTLLPRLRQFAQTNWNSPRPVPTFADFDPYLRFLGRAPQFGVVQHFSLTDPDDVG